jgi:hypothetical protein
MRSVLVVLALPRFAMPIYYYRLHKVSSIELNGEK